MIDKQEDILKKLLTFHESLYSENQQCCEKDCCDFIRPLSLPSINKAKLSECDKLITDSECHEAIFQLANNTWQQIFVYLPFLVFLYVFGVADANFDVIFCIVLTVLKIFATN